MQITTEHMTVSSYCTGMQRGEIIVNREYQRSDLVWPPIARSFLIETILLGYPIPKLSLYQITDVRSKRTVREIVDGQQRSTALLDFYENRLTLLPSLELEDARGRTYDELPDELKGHFLNYSLTFDLFLAATPSEIRETFRRMNSYTVPLNPEEQRHALWQGQMRWFIQRVAKSYDDSFEQMGLFTRKQLVRMADTKLFAELVHAILHGITTTSKIVLDRLYKEYDRTLPREEELGGYLAEACDRLIDWKDLWGTALMKPHQAYSLLLAVIHVGHPVAPFQSDFHVEDVVDLSRPGVVEDLSRLASALDDEEGSARQFREFVEASSSRTNVGEQRRRRFVWYCRALTGQLS